MIRYFFFRQKPASQVGYRIVGWEMCIRDGSKTTPPHMHPKARLPRLKGAPKQDYPASSAPQRTTTPPQMHPTGRLPRLKCVPKQDYLASNAHQSKTTPPPLHPQGRLPRRQGTPQDDYPAPIALSYTHLTRPTRSPAEH